MKLIVGLPQRQDNLQTRHPIESSWNLDGCISLYWFSREGRIQSNLIRKSTCHITMNAFAICNDLYKLCREIVAKTSLTTLLFIIKPVEPAS